DLASFVVEEWEDDDVRATLQVGERLTFQMGHLDVDAWLRDLQNDKQQLDILLSSASQVTTERDAKLGELKAVIKAKVDAPTTTKDGQQNRKVLVFTAFADTAAYLYEVIRPWARDALGIHCALVTGGAVENRTTLGRNEFSHILTNFAPVAKRR